MSEDLNTKSLGEKLYEALTSTIGDGISWSALTVEEITLYEKAALTFAASLSHDETANAVITDLRARLQAAEERAERLSLSMGVYKTADALRRCLEANRCPDPALVEKVDACLAILGHAPLSAALKTEGA